MVLAHHHITRLIPKNKKKSLSMLQLRVSFLSIKLDCITHTHLYIDDNDHGNLLFSSISFSLSFLVFNFLDCTFTNRHMFDLLIILIYSHLHLLFHSTSASGLLFRLDHVRYSLSDRIITIPKLGALRGIHIDYEHQQWKKYHLVNVEAFLGIEYGLYHGRFEPSKERFELHPTMKVNKQIHFGSACAQHIWRNPTELSRIRNEKFAQEYYPKLLKFIEHQSEDQCLYMNIYQPQIKDLKGRRRKKHKRRIFSFFD